MERVLAITSKSISNMVDGFFAILPNLVIGVFVILVFLQIANLSKGIVTRLGEKAKLDLTLCQALASLASFALSIFGLLVAMVVICPTFKPGHLVAGLGITSVAIGFAFKDILQNFFAGLFLLWQKPFKIGDQIRTLTYEGTVQRIDIRSTRIITHNGELVVLPNDDLWTNPIVVTTAFDKRRSHLSVAVPAGVDFASARAAIIQTLMKNEGVLKEPEAKVYLASLDSGDLKFDLYYWTKPRDSDVLSTTDRLAVAIKSAIDELTAEKSTQPDANEKSGGNGDVSVNVASQSRQTV